MVRSGPSRFRAIQFDLGKRNHGSQFRSQFRDRTIADRESLHDHDTCPFACIGPGVRGLAKSNVLNVDLPLAAEQYGENVYFARIRSYVLL